MKRYRERDNKDLLEPDISYIKHGRSNAKKSYREAIIQVLEEADYSITFSDLDQKVKKTRPKTKTPSLRVILGRLVDSGTILKLGSGVSSLYCINEVSEINKCYNSRVVADGVEDGVRFHNFSARLRSDRLVGVSGKFRLNLRGGYATLSFNAKGWATWSMFAWAGRNHFRKGFDYWDSRYVRQWVSQVLNLHTGLTLDDCVYSILKFDKSFDMVRAKVNRSLRLSWSGVDSFFWRVYDFRDEEYGGCVRLEECFRGKADLHEFDNAELLTIFRGDMFAIKVVKDHQDMKNTIFNQDQANRRWSSELKEELVKIRSETAAATEEKTPNSFEHINGAYVLMR